jgi:hypothetical protein
VGISGELTCPIASPHVSGHEKFNYVRNDDSLAHDNELPDPAEARFLFDSIVAILRFMKSIEAARFGS